ncbi:phospholipase D family protein [Roseomonas sp. 573]|uniref:Phospholipase D family protein n=1 Tax=Roseomonas haemaphysalidis TaxID=2768162 RepID=A0ABS3KW67_9PROT|nr:phospholipase D family protein [Roseomonas haemaphysalidis]
MLGGINGQYLLNITENAARDTDEVLAAVAYATNTDLLFDWCWNNKIPLRFYGRLDDQVAVAAPVLENFLRRRSGIHVCKLVQHHHAKVIWWRGVGVYIGSANLTDRAWYKNVEAGCFFTDDEITDEMAADLHGLFATLEEHATPLTQELLSEMRARAHEVHQARSDAKRFWGHPSLITWPGLVQTTPKGAAQKRRDSFLKEWHATLEHLRNIGLTVSHPENRPIWVNGAVPIGAQADQFLHAFYYQRTFAGTKANYAAHYEQNKMRPDSALAEAVTWWRGLATAPQSEDYMLNVSAPALQAALAEPQLATMTGEQFREVCDRVHAIRDYSRRVRNQAVNLPDGTNYNILQKLDALADRIWNDQGSMGGRVRDLLHHILYNGSSDQLPERLWQGIVDPKWKIEGLGVSALGELVGWALPDHFPPRNGRTSKALRALGYPVTIHVGQ